MAQLFIPVVNYYGGGRWGDKAHIKIRSHIKQDLGHGRYTKTPAIYRHIIAFRLGKKILPSHVLRPSHLLRQSFAGYKLGQDTKSREN
jgi:hypothetical protein